jgi:hypothetical protein
MKIVLRENQRPNYVKNADGEVTRLRRGRMNRRRAGVGNVRSLPLAAASDEAVVAA